MKDTDIIAAIAPDAVSLMDKAIAEIKRLRQENATLTAERDEARREVCLSEGIGSIQLAKEIAAERGWDCFREEVQREAVFAQQDVAYLRAENADLKARLDTAWGDVSAMQGIVDRLTAERDALAAKADPLAEMWRELAEYQPMADRDGHGESWRRMCKERTEEAARAAWDAAWAAAAAAWATERAAEAIAAIRRAKEVRR